MKEGGALADPRLRAAPSARDDNDARPVIPTARLASYPDARLIVISACCHSVRLFVISTDRRERRNLHGDPADPSASGFLLLHLRPLPRAGPLSAPLLFPSRGWFASGATSACSPDWFRFRCASVPEGVAICHSDCPFGFLF